jgi:hypothetical protein
MDTRNRTLQGGDFYPSYLADMKGSQMTPRGRNELVCFRETDIIQVSVSEIENSRDYRLFKIHHVTRQVWCVIIKVILRVL